MTNKAAFVVLLLVAALTVAGGLYWWFAVRPASPIQLQLVVTYADGSTKIYEGEIAKPLAVAQTGTTKPITNIQAVVKAKPSWVQQPQEIGSGVVWTCSGKVSVDGVQKKLITGSGPTSIKSGTTYTISTINISGDELQAYVPFDYRDHTIKFDVIVGCTFTPPGDRTTSIDGSAFSELALKNIGFPALLSVTVSSSAS